MLGLKMNVMSRKEILAVVRDTLPSQDFVWNGADPDERPATAQELRAGVESYRKKRGRTPSSAAKEQVAIRFDHDVLEAFRAAGPGWQTRTNDALKDWSRAHSIF